MSFRRRVHDPHGVFPFLSPGSSLPGGGTTLTMSRAGVRRSQAESVELPDCANPDTYPGLILSPKSFCVSLSTHTIDKLHVSAQITPCRRLGRPRSRRSVPCSVSERSRAQTAERVSEAILKRINRNVRGRRLWTPTERFWYSLASERSRSQSVFMRSA